MRYVATNTAHEKQMSTDDVLCRYLVAFLADQRQRGIVGGRCNAVRVCLHRLQFHSSFSARICVVSQYLHVYRSLAHFASRISESSLLLTGGRQPTCGWALGIASWERLGNSSRLGNAMREHSVELLNESFFLFWGSRSSLLPCFLLVLYVPTGC